MTDQGRDSRGALLTLQEICQNTRRAGLEIARVLREIAAMASNENKYGMGSTSQMKPASVVRILCFVACIALRARADSFALKDGDRVVFYGDSITDQRLYTTFTETYVLTRFPKLDVTFVHSGWGGDRVTGGGGGPIDVRLRRDVFAYKPTVVTIMLGMNDGSYRAFDETIFETYAKGYQHIIDSVKLLLAGYSASCGSRLRAS